jgi:hypothetical protein
MTALPHNTVSTVVVVERNNGSIHYATAFNAGRHRVLRWRFSTRPVGAPKRGAITDKVCGNALKVSDATRSLATGGLLDQIRDQDGAKSSDHGSSARLSRRFAGRTPTT